MDKVLKHRVDCLVWAFFQVSKRGNSNLTQPMFQINQNGYIYVYSCNTSAMTVRTDNLFIAHYQGSLLEEFHYYPFGMCFDVSKSPMLGKSAKPLKCMLKDYKDMEDCGDFLGVCEAASRNYDAQIGRWLQPDPLMQHPSPYLAMSNNPVSFTDPTGLWDGNNPKFVGEIRNGFMWNGQMWELFETTVTDKNHLMMGSFESTVVNEANLPDNSSGTQVSGVNGKLRRVGDAYNRGHYIENERNWAKGMNAANRSIGRSIWNIFMTGYANGKRPEYIVSVSLADNPLNWLIGGGSIGSLIKTAKGGTSGLKTFGSLTEKFGEGYKSIAVTQGKHLPIQLGQKLNTMSLGSWSKIYEAGILNGSKVEKHYFFNSTTGQYVNPFIKSSGWGRTFKGVTGY